MLKFTEDHEWIRIEGNQAIVGITDYAVEQLGDIVFIELPAIGDDFNKGDVVATVESVKAASEIYCPLAGEVIDINNEIVNDPAGLNADPQGMGWFFKIRLNDPAAAAKLMDEEAYRASIA